MEIKNRILSVTFALEGHSKTFFVQNKLCLHHNNDFQSSLIT